jgi:hypothetical protein
MVFCGGYYAVLVLWSVKNVRSTVRIFSYGHLGKKMNSVLNRL